MSTTNFEECLEDTLSTGGREGGGGGVFAMQVCAFLQDSGDQIDWDATLPLLYVTIEKKDVHPNPYYFCVEAKAT